LPRLQVVGGCRCRQRRGHAGLVGRLLSRHCGRRGWTREQGRALCPAVGQQVQLVKNPRDVDGAHRLRQHADRAQRARLAEVQLAFLRRVHHHRDGGGARVQFLIVCTAWKPSMPGIR
jgi:hypothetical protein